jgi:cell division protein FtsB
MNILDGFYLIVATLVALAALYGLYRGARTFVKGAPGEKALTIEHDANETLERHNNALKDEIAGLRSDIDHLDQLRVRQDVLIEELRKMVQGVDAINKLGELMTANHKELVALLGGGRS